MMLWVYKPVGVEVEVLPYLVFHELQRFEMGVRGMEGLEGDSASFDA